MPMPLTPMTTLSGRAYPDTLIPSSGEASDDVAGDGGDMGVGGQHTSPVGGAGGEDRAGRGVKAQGGRAWAGRRLPGGEAPVGRQRRDAEDLEVPRGAVLPRRTRPARRVEFVGRPITLV